MGYVSGSIKPYSRAAGADEFYSVAFRRKVYSSIEELQAALDEWMGIYNRKRETTFRKVLLRQNALPDIFGLFASGPDKAFGRSYAK